MNKLVEMLGGISKIIGPEDVVVIKPNVQWWNQGAPNLAALKRFIELILEMPGGFKGEVVIAENCHRGSSPWLSENAGWAHVFERNSDIAGIRNFNDLTGSLKKKYGERYSTRHWIDVGAGARRVFGPKDGDGYVYCDGTGGVPLLSCSNGMAGEKSRTTIMTYPIFKTDKGKTVDFKNGIWEKGAYTGQPLRFINFAALNNHSISCGATSAIKNYLGVVDLSERHYNFHTFPLSEEPPGEQVELLGAEVAGFVKSVRKADLNITTAEWIGLASRTEPPVARTRAILASTDPVALDYHATKYLLFANSDIAHHNPDLAKSPVHKYLSRCAKDGGGVFDEEKVEVRSYDIKQGRLQKDEELLLVVEKVWGTNPKILTKYFALRLGVI
ncbi:MAG: DUF362 domain-containing protein [Acidobacteria bacterium]|nr:DUF362 domain-containing protein [Acidobacteriota bacterium]